MDYTLTVTSGTPEAEPVTLAQAKRHLRIDHDEEDDLIRMWIQAAREYCETHCQRRFVTQTVVVKLCSWPGSQVICLDMFGANDITAVTIEYLDINGDEQTLSTTQYQTEFAHQPPLIVAASGVTWPDLEVDRIYPVTLTLTVGKRPPDVPAAVRSAMLLMLSYWDENRGGEGGEAKDARGIPAGALRLLDSVWTGAYP